MYEAFWGCYNDSNASHMNSQSTESNAFSKSTANAWASNLFFFVNSMLSSIVRIPSPMNLFFHICDLVWDVLMKASHASVCQHMFLREALCQNLSKRLVSSFL